MKELLINIISVKSQQRSIDGSLCPHAIYVSLIGGV